MPAGNVSVEAVFEHDANVIIGEIAAANGTATVDKSYAEKDDIVTLTVVPESGKRVSAVTAASTVPAEEEGGDPTVTALEVVGPLAGNAVKYAFAQGEGTTDVTVTFVDEVATETYTIASEATWVKADDTADHSKEYYLFMNGLEKTESGRQVYTVNKAVVAKYAVPENKNTIVKAELIMSAAAGDYDGEWKNGKLDYARLKDDTWTAATITQAALAEIAVDTFTRTEKWTERFQSIQQPQYGANDPLSSVTDPHGPFGTTTLDITNAVKAETDQVLSIVLGSNSRNIIVRNAPVLKLTIGQAVNFNVSAAANAETKIDKAAIVIKSGETTVATGATDESGAASFALSAGSYTYTVTTADYAIKNGTLTVEAATVNEDVSLAANEPGSVVITSPSDTNVTTAQPITFTAKVYDQDNREMTDETVTWSIVDSPANIAVSNEDDETNGQVSVTTGVTAGNYQVQAAVTSKTSVTSTANFTVKVADPATVTIKFQDTEGTQIKDDVTISSLFVGDEFTLDKTNDAYKSYFTTYKKDNNDGSYAVYTYNDTATTTANSLSIAELAATQDIVLKYTSEGNYVVYEDYEGTSPTALLTNKSRTTISTGT